MFIVIDWIDGSGKGTQVKIVSEKLKAMWKNVLVLDYPRYGEKSAFMVEKYLNWDYWKEVWPKLASIFYAIDRFDDYRKIKNNLNKYDYIISNRYISANMIHQAGKINTIKEKEEFLSWVEDLEYNIFWIPRPNKTIFLNISPEISQKLVLKKKKREYLKLWKKMDLHEEDKNHLKNAHDTALIVVEKNPDWFKIDCEKDGEMRKIEEITDDILKEIL